MVKEAIETLGAGLGLFESITGAIQKVRESRMSTENILRAYFLEVSANLKLLELLRDDLKDLQADNEGYIAFISRLQTAIGSAIIFDESGNIGKTYNTLKKADPGGLLQKIASTVVRIAHLKIIADFSPDERKLLHGIRLGQRLENIRGDLFEICGKLKELEGVKELYFTNKD
jgi:hypothetical protein